MNRKKLNIIVVVGLAVLALIGVGLAFLLVK
jgi:hypothetical protein